MKKQRNKNYHMEQPTTESLTGIIDRFIFQTSDKQFSVCILITDDKRSITATGALAHVHEGQEVTLHGSWATHKKFGKQFTIVQCIPKLPSTITGIKKYLGSGLIKGIGQAYADRLVNHFGTDILKVLDADIQRLKEVPGIGEKRIEIIAAAWKDQKDIAELMSFLQDKGISITYASKIYKQYQHNALAILHENPYRIADDIWGISFKIADIIALKMGFHIHAPVRIKAALLFILNSSTTSGHLYCPLEELKIKTATLLELDLAEQGHLLKTGLSQLYEAEKITYITHEGVHYITLRSFYFSEKGVAQKIQSLIDTPSLFAFDTQAIEQLLAVPHAGDVQLNEDQKKGIVACLHNKITIITGGPGTGKTTLIKKLLNLLEGEQISYKLAAPTGRASKRMMESTGRHALTLHRLLEFDVASMSFTYNETKHIKSSFIIIDEASMIDIFLAHALLKAISPTTHLIFLGDTDQLPSVGAGNFLHDCITSQKIPSIKLTQIFRQAQNSLIIINAHRVNKGEYPLAAGPDARHDFIFIKEEEPLNTLKHIKEIINNHLPYHKIALSDATVLVPMNKGTVGTQALNQQLQELLNPAKKDAITANNIHYAMHDRVMQIANNYEKLVFNGDIGTIDSINHTDKELIINFNDRLVTYLFEELNELVLAYAITIHKSQGSEYPAVIIPLFMQHFTLLQRNLIYTAITRAKKLCIFIGQPKALAIALRNNKSIKRLTFLQTFLNETIPVTP